jgi:glycosyltransferase involved in cell wall biosynthesis
MCDTSWYPQDLKRQYGVSLDKVSTVYFPVHVGDTPIYRAVSEPRVLWAGRFTKQKRVDLLIEIAGLLPGVVFDVYGYAVHDYEREMEDKMRALPNIRVHGAFDSLKSVVAKNSYSLLLYTSGWDGLPITLLDATIAGLPVVASAVGGVPEFISEEAGYPVWDHNSPSAYVERINEAMADDFARRRKWEAAVALILSRHTAEHFSGQLKGVSGYLGDE